MVEIFESWLYFKIFFLYLIFNQMEIIYSSKINDLDVLKLVAFQLSNQKNTIFFTNKGFYTIDQDYSIIYEYPNEMSINVELRSNYPFFAQFKEENGIVLCLIINNLFVFDSEGQLLTSKVINEIPSVADYEYNNNNCIINAFKKSGNDYYYIILYNDFSTSIKYYYYKINEEWENLLLYSNSYSRENEVLIQSDCITCQRIKIEDNKYNLTCFYQYSYIGTNYISEITFAPDDNFSHIEPRISFLKNNNQDFNYGISVSNEDGSRIYVCYTSQVSNATCFYYNTQKREFSQRYILNNTCKGNFYFINFYYVKIEKKYMFSCANYQFTLSFVKFNEEMKSFETNTTFVFQDFYFIDSYSFIYSFSSNQYILFLNGKNSYDANFYTIKKYEISNFVSFSNQSEYIKSDTIIASLVKPTEISITNKITESVQITESVHITESNKIIESTQIAETTQATESTQITESIQITESNKLIISSEIFETEPITNIKTSEITSTTDINNEPNEEKISTQVITSTELTDAKLTNKVTEFPEIKVEITESNKIIDFTEIPTETEIKTNTIKVYDDDYCKDEGMKINNKGECVCNNENGYYPISLNNNIYDNKCYNNETKPENFYLNKERKQFEICHKYCRTCNFHGNEEQNNCTSCIDNYQFVPDIKRANNCFVKCEYYYYFNIYELYSCTSNFQCPAESNLLIRKKNKCIDDCSKDDTYQYQYSGECYIECPEGTIPNGYKCEVEKKNLCSLSNYNLSLTFNELIKENIDIYSKNYAEEFNYTNNKIMNYTNKEYSLVFYKNVFCIKELSLTIPQIDFGDCYQKVQFNYNITEDLLIAILDKYVDNGNPITSYLFFNPIDGERINASEICKDENIILKENVLTFQGIDPYIVKFFADQNINIFNISDKFYSDICKHYKSPNNKDIPLQLRFQIYFPNISLCDENCISKGVDLKTMESICYCPFTDFNKNSFVGSVFEFSGVFGEVYSFLRNSNINILFCIKEIFNYEYFKRSIGGFIIMILIFFETICVIVYSQKGITSVKKYIFNISSSYIKSEKIKIKNNPPKNHRKINKKLTSNKLDSLNISSIKKLKIIDDKDIKKEIKSIKTTNPLKSPKPIKSKKTRTTKRNSKHSKISQKSIYLSKFSNKILIQNISNRNLLDEKPDKINITNFSEYLSTDPDDMDFDDVIEKDKRTFCEYFCESIKNRLIIIKSFFIEDKIKPKSIKIMIFILNIVFYLSINGLMYSEQYISDLYNNENEKLSQFISRIFEHLIYVGVITKVLNEIIDCFFVEEKKIKGILIRGKDNYKKIKIDIILLIKKIEKNNLIFIIISYGILAFSWAYISCFNDVYIYTRKDWIMTTIIFFITIQIFLIILNLIETIIRFISIHCQSEKLFKLSQFIS